jgi:hypothetical protein
MRCAPPFYTASYSWSCEVEEKRTSLRLGVGPRQGERKLAEGWVRSASSGTAATRYLIIFETGFVTHRDRLKVKRNRHGETPTPAATPSPRKPRRIVSFKG